MKRAISLLIVFTLLLSVVIMPVFLAAEEDYFTEPGANFEKPISPEEEAVVEVYSQEDAEVVGTENQEHDAAVH